MSIVEMALGAFPLWLGRPCEDQRPARAFELGVIVVTLTPHPPAGESWGKGCHMEPGIGVPRE